MSIVSDRVRFTSFPGRTACTVLVMLLLPASLAGQLTVAPPAGQACPVSPPGAVAVLDHVRWLADDALAGREAGSAGERCAAAYLATRFSELGLQPAGPDGGWYQPFPVRSGSELGAANRLEISGRPEALGKSWTPYGFSGSGEVEGRLVYAGSGVSAPGTPQDRFAHLDLEGAIAVIDADAPGLSGLQRDPHFRATVMAGRRAAGLIVLLPAGRPLPALADEMRPFVRIPVIAVTGEREREVRRLVEAGAIARISAEVTPRVVEAYNVVALLPGQRGGSQAVVVGAHYDHLGMGGEGSLAPDSREVHNGADDNASGAAALIEIAGRLRTGPPPGASILFVAFGGEERGLLGSSHYVTHPAVPLARTRAMINLDMVGRLGDGALTIFGMATAAEWEQVVRAANGAQPDPLRLSLLPDGFGPSDHAAFWGQGVPVLHFFTGTHEDYHRPSDDWQRVDPDGLERVAALAADVASRLAGSPSEAAVALTAAEPEPAAHGAPASGQPSASGGYGPYFGSIPDMTPQDFGVRITGVREDSPAARAGLRSGDVIVSFGGKEIADLYAFTYALQEHQPGDQVEVVVSRDGERVTVTAVLAERR